MYITIYKNIHDTNTGFKKSIIESLERIKTGASKDLLDSIRKEKDKKKRNDLKRSLPSICFSGEFKNRSDIGLIKHSGFICLDFDGFPSNEELILYKDSFSGNDYVYSVFISPSGNGLKVIIKIPECKKEDHKRYFKALEGYFDSEYFDISCSNISRVCYESYDPDIYINEDSILWKDKGEEEILTYGNDIPKLVLKNDNQIIQNIMVWFEKNYSMTEGNRNENIFKCAICMSDYGVEMSDCEYTLGRYAEKDFTEDEIRNTIKSAYRRGAATFGTKFFEDANSYKKIEDKIKQGDNYKDIVSSFTNHNREDIEDAINQIKSSSTILEFWEFNSKGKISIQPNKFKEFLQQNGFAKIYIAEGSSYIFVEINSNVVSNTTNQKIKDFVLNYLLTNHELFGIKPYNYMADNPRFFKDEYLSLLGSVNISFKEDTQEKCYLYYQNCALEIYNNKVVEIDYLDLDGFIWDTQIIDRDYINKDHHKAEYRRFLWLISGEKAERYNSLKSATGYLLHSFKTSGTNKAIIFNDEVISENPNGGSGKGLFCNAIGHMKKVSTLDGKQFDFNKSFAYQTVSADTQVIVFDDVKKNFHFENLFSLITEGMTLEKKNKDAIHIPVSKSPKVVITTNYTIGGIGGSFERRKFEIELSSYFGAHHAPFNEFGHYLFDDWSSEEWMMFDNYMIECLKYFLENGLVEHQYVNLEQRKFIRSTCYEFSEWMEEEENLVLGARYVLKNLYNKFIGDEEGVRSFINPRMFNRWIDLFIKYKGYYSKKTRLASGKCIVISTKPINKIEEEPKDNGVPF